jgi:hypothetical protein
MVPVKHPHNFGCVGAFIYSPPLPFQRYPISSANRFCYNKKMESDPTINREIIDYEALKKSLLDGSIIFTDVLKKLSELDQSTLSRDYSEQNLIFLINPEIVNYINQHAEFLSDYYDFLSFTQFHIGQRRATDNLPEAINYFRQALESARLNISSESWTAYVEGTLLYMEGKNIPKEIIIKVEENRNAQILENLNLGLKQRGFPLYSEDYGK